MAAISATTLGVQNGSVVPYVSRTYTYIKGGVPVSGSQPGGSNTLVSDVPTGNISSSGVPGSEN